jgi:predicted dehydrogenase
MSSDMNRRDFSQFALWTAAGAALKPVPAPASASEQVRLGFLGVGNRGCQLLEAFLAQPDARVVAVCDVYDPYLHAAYDRVDPRFLGLGKRIPRMPELPAEVARVRDFRRVLDRSDLDAVVIATPDHWHAIQTIQACQAGKDVYVEKPLSITIAEGRAMVDAARRHNRVVQVGTQRRSSALFAGLAHAIDSGAIGKVTFARAAYCSNMTPRGIGKAEPSAPPGDLDWDLWLGPRPLRPFQENILPYKFRWWSLYSSQMANWGVHYFDLIRWLTGEVAPRSVATLGGRFAVDDDRTIPDTAEALFEHASGMITSFLISEASGHPVLPDGAEVEIRGTLGTVLANSNGYRIVPERGGQFQDPTPRRKPEEVTASPGDRAADLDRRHARAFLDCVKSRSRPVADVEEGHRSTVFAHLANIALVTRARLDWDAQAERFTNHDAANALRHYEYRPPWVLP